jgi:hypothetical protein
MRSARPIQFLILLPCLAALLSGCSSEGTKVGVKAAESNGVRIEMTTSPDPMQAGDNVVMIHLTDMSSGQPVVDANVTISAFNELAGGGDRESGRSQGNGDYNVPIKLGIPDKYNLDIEVQRPGEQDSDATFTINAG